MRTRKWLASGLLTGCLFFFSAGAALAVDNWDSSTPDDDTAGNTRNALLPGDPPQRHDAEAVAATADEDWFRLSLVAGHSYEVRVTGRQDQCFDFFGANFQVLQSDAVTLITTGVDASNTGALRSSYRAIIPPVTTTQFGFVRLVGDAACTATSEYNIQLFDTTLFNPLWSTNGSFETFYRISNTTNDTINATLRMFNNAGVEVANTAIAIPGNSTAPTINTGPTGLNIADNNAGQALITHDGPAGGLLVDGFTGIFSVFPPVVLPIKVSTATP